MKREEKEMEKEVALKYVKAYCEENGYDYDRLKDLYYDTAFGEGMFFLPPLVSGEGGLTVDRESQPRGVLAVKPDFTIYTTPLLEELKIK